MDYYVKLSRFLSLVLRHEPQKIGIELDAQGWTDCETLLNQSQSEFPGFNRQMLEELVAGSDKRRFAFNEDGSRVRANQGHSVDIDLAMKAQEPPKFLYHGTVSRFLNSIREEGLTKRQRHHVHLSADQHTAGIVGERRGDPVILTIRAAEMSAAGLLFYRSDNGVWLTDSVRPEFIDFPER